MIYTAGYYGRDIHEFKATVEQMNALLIDIRLVSWSRFFPEWRKNNLEGFFGDNYLHIPELGNRAYKEKRIEIQNLDFGLRVIGKINRNAILLCACKHYDKCHRQVVADELRVRGFEVKELS